MSFKVPLCLALELSPADTGTLASTLIHLKDISLVPVIILNCCQLQGCGGWLVGDPERFRFVMLL